MVNEGRGRTARRERLPRGEREEEGEGTAAGGGGERRWWVGERTRGAPGEVVVKRARWKGVRPLAAAGAGLARWRARNRFWMRSLEVRALAAGAGRAKGGVAGGGGVLEAGGGEGNGGGEGGKSESGGKG